MWRRPFRLLHGPGRHAARVLRLPADLGDRGSQLVGRRGDRLNIGRGMLRRDDHLAGKRLRDLRRLSIMELAPDSSPSRRPENDFTILPTAISNRRRACASAPCARQLRAPSPPSHPLRGAGTPQRIPKHRQHLGDAPRSRRCDQYHGPRSRSPRRAGSATAPPRQRLEAAAHEKSRQHHDKQRPIPATVIMLMIAWASRLS